MQSTDRLHALDAVRAYALLLGVVLHTLASFLEGFPIPMWGDEPSDGAAAVYFVIHMFRMSAFFLIAGFFARMVVERRGVKAFLKDRGKRIALPLLVGLPVVMITMGIGFVLGALAHGTDYLVALGAEMSDAQTALVESGAAGPAFNFQHLWFLYYLLLFYAISLGLRAVFARLDPSGLAAALGDRIVAVMTSGIWGPAIIALPIAVYLIVARTAAEWIGLPAPVSVVPDVTALIGYGIPFGLGWLAHRSIDRLLGLQAQWFVYLGAAVALTFVCFTIGGVAPHWNGPVLAGAERVLYIAAYTFGLWCWVFAFVGAAVRFLSEPHPVTRYLADASYWVYLMHLATILFFITLLKPYEWHWIVKSSIIIGGSMPILLLSYHYLVRFTWIGATLNGRRHRRAAITRGDEAAAAG